MSLANRGNCCSSISSTYTNYSVSLASSGAGPQQPWEVPHDCPPPLLSTCLLVGVGKSSTCFPRTPIVLGLLKGLLAWLSPMSPLRCAPWCLLSFREFCCWASVPKEVLLGYGILHLLTFYLHFLIYFSVLHLKKIRLVLRFWLVRTWAGEFLSVLGYA